jgi:hypothetical protein
MIVPACSFYDLIRQEFNAPRRRCAELFYLGIFVGSDHSKAVGGGQQCGQQQGSNLHLSYTTNDTDTLWRGVMSASGT